MGALQGHPKGLYLIFATSTAERFSYYGMRAIFILFLTQALLFDTEAAPQKTERRIPQYLSAIYPPINGVKYTNPV